MIDLIVACNKTGRFLLRRPAKVGGQWSFIDVYWPTGQTMVEAIGKYADNIDLSLLLNQATSIYNNSSRAYLYWCNEETIPVDPGYEHQWFGLYEMPDKSTIDRFIHSLLGDPHFVAAMCKPQFDEAT
jgi:hypothetical protein